MNTSSSDLSSGCESGWTQYFVEPSSSKSRRNESMKMMCGEYLEEDRNNCYGGGEDMSMVSDASSGPRQYNDAAECFNQNECSSHHRNYASESKQKKNRNGKQKDRSQLDDTASSHSKESRQPSMYYNPSHVQENSTASIPKGRSSRKKYFGL